VTTPDLDRAYKAQLRELGALPFEAPLTRNKINVVGDIIYFRFLSKMIRNLEIDFVLNYTIKPNIWGGLASGRAGVRSVSMVTGLGFAFIQADGFFRFIKQRIAQKLYRLATNSNSVVVFQNPDDLSDFLEAGCISKNKATVIVNGSGLDLNHYSVALLPSEPVFLSMARLLRSKGLEEYAEASLKVRNEIPNARFLLAGMMDTGPDAFSQEDLDKWIGSGIEYLGHLDDVRPAIAEASVFVLPSWREGTPRTVLEAMGMGRPIVTTDAPGCRETTVDGVNGFLVAVRDSDSLANAMIRLGRDSALRTKMGTESRRIAELKYSVKEVNKDLIRYLGL
jgi:glycosyltransferase involved in cell wall biosynthesis